MNRLAIKLFTMTTATLMALTLVSEAFAEGNAKRGRVYFKMVCTVCHITQSGTAIPPNSRTMADWTTYMDINKHDTTGKTNSSVAYLTSKQYRESIADSNRAAKKFLKLGDAQLLADVRTFVITGAKDSDTPASCQ